MAILNDDLAGDGRLIVGRRANLKSTDKLLSYTGVCSCVASRHPPN